MHADVINAPRKQDRIIHGWQAGKPGSEPTHYRKPRIALSKGIQCTFYAPMFHGGVEDLSALERIALSVNPPVVRPSS